ncbi:MAG: hypothetical protein ACRCS3_01945 [Paracoccaceae bacterium]
MRVALLLCLFASPALADGLAITDLTQAPDITATLGEGFLSKVEADRITYVCFECPGAPMVDVLMGQQTDGTEDRIRSGETTMDDMQTICQSREPDCTLEGLSLAPAVGFRSAYPVMGRSGSTTVVMLGGDMITIRSIADDPAVARDTAIVIESHLIPAIIGN